MGHLDQLYRLLQIALTAQVGHAILGNHRIHKMICVVDVAGKGNNAGDASSLGGRTASKDAEIGVVRKVGRASDAVHHLCSANLRTVHMAIDVNLNGCIERTHTDTGDNFRVVADFGRTQHKLVSKEINIVIDTAQALVRNSQRAAAGTQHTAVTDQLDGSVLQHLGVNIEIGDFGTFSQSTQHRVSTATHATLQIQEGRGNQATAHIVQKEVSHILTDLIRDGVRILERTGLIGYVTLDNTHNAACVHLDIGFADAVVSLQDRDGLAERMVLNLINIMQSLTFGAVESV